METPVNSNTTLTPGGRSALITLLLMVVFLCVAPVIGGIAFANFSTAANSAGCDTLQGIGQQIGGGSVENPTTADSCKAAVRAQRPFFQIVGTGLVFVPMLMIWSLYYFVFRHKLQSNSTTDEAAAPPATE